jgi:hypothetical protein
MTYAT